MALQESHEIRWGRQAWYLALVGAADLPSSGGAFQVGDMVVNWNPVVGAPAMWQCITASPNPAWTPIGQIGTSNTTVNVQGVAYTVAATDRYVELTTAVAITLPAATVYPVAKPVTIMSKGVAYTVTPASGNIYSTTGTTAFTGTASSHIEVITDGTNYYVVG